ncbi:serine/threonine protein kinase [Myxococcota bacterium]|nr:serine/threonine protein kinase [Myxococcota bacterium]
MGREQPQPFGKYLLLEQIGLGGMAEVWHACQFGAAGFQKRLVIKKLLPEFAENDEFVKMFINEAKISVSLQHSNIVQVFDLGLADNEYFIAMEEIKGRDLFQVLKRCADLKIKFPYKLSIYIIIEVLKGLELAHNSSGEGGKLEKIVHRDVSPENIMISFNGEVKVADFGIAKVKKSNQASSENFLKGKFGYMSPEQLKKQEIDLRSDLFSVGVVLFEMISMQRLFKGKNTIEIAKSVHSFDINERVIELKGQIPGELIEILKKVLAYEPKNRFNNASEFLESLVYYSFERSIRATGPQLSRFMKSIFSEEIEDEARRDLRIEAQIKEYLEGSNAQLSATPQVLGEVKGLRRFSRRDKFRVKEQGGVIYGPMGFDTFIEISNRNGFDGSEEISIDGQTWFSPAQLTPILRGTNITRSINPAPDFSGAFDRFDLPRLLYRYAVFKVTGRMEITHDGYKKEIFWRSGRPEFITSNIKSELLGEFLIQQGVLTRASLNMALERLGDFGGHLGDVLMHLSLISARSLFEHLSLQLELKLYELFTWPKGAYSFFKGGFNHAQVVPFDRDALALIFEGTRRAFSFEDLEGFFRARWDKPMLKRAHKILKLENLPLKPVDYRVWELIVHRKPFSQQIHHLLLAQGATEAQIYTLLFFMERLDFLSFGD